MAIPTFPDPDDVSNEAVTTAELKALVVDLVRAVTDLEDRVAVLESA